MLDTQKLQTIKQVQDRVAKDNKIQHKSISPYMAVKTRLAEAKQIFSDYFANWSKLDQWGDQLQERNPGYVLVGLQREFFFAN